ncbi:MAG: hypothetical protein AAGK74_16990, partial [Chloroflexota bacterium]
MRDQQNLPDTGSGIPERSGYLVSVLSEIIKLRTANPTGRRRIIQVSIDTCCEALMFGTRDAALRHFDQLLARGLPMDALVETVFPHCAARMGQMWADDTASFADVSLGTSMLHMALRHVEGRYLKDAKPGTGKRILLFTLDDETHLFAPLLLTAMLEREGHTVQRESGVTTDVCLQIAATAAHDIVGISLGKTENNDRLVELLGGLKSFSGAPIMVGGPGLPAEIPGALVPFVDFWGSD